MESKINRSHVPSAKVMNEWNYISNPPIYLCLYVVNNGRFILILPFLLVSILDFFH